MPRPRRHEDILQAARVGILLMSEVIAGAAPRNSHPRGVYTNEDIS